MDRTRSKNCIRASLPLELIFDILSRVPANSLTEFKTVCKSWHATIKDPQFMESHLSRSLSQRQRSYVLLDEYGKDIYHLIDEQEYEWRASKELILDDIDKCLYMFGSCNGLVCISPGYGTAVPVFLCNIITRECVLLPATEEPDTGDFDVTDQCMCLGYDQITRKYKVIRMFWIELDTGLRLITDISTVGEPSRRRLELPSPKCLSDHLSILHVEGSFYWIASNGSGAYFHDDIVSFNLHTEKSGIIKCPTSDGTSVHCRFVMDLGGALGLVEQHQYNNHFWKLIDGNWIFQYAVISMDRPLCMCDKDVFLTTRLGLHKDRLFLHDARKELKLEVEVSGGPLRFHTCSFVPSLVSPRAIMMEQTEVYNS